MTNFNRIALKTIRITSWPLLAIVIASFVTGYMMSNRYGLAATMQPEKALVIHKLLHVPLLVLLVPHTIAAAYLALKRKG
ncbi:MAG: hypothetical protein NT105_18895 [Verrucomicrobia bacterium]|nr:hypothetical protein [Verrucomicrobiota bacterium]